MKKSTVYEPMDCKTALNRVNAPSMPFDWSLNPYRGCQHGCSFCYARSTHAFLDLKADDTFQHHILLKENAPTQLRKQLQVWTRSGKPLPGSIAIGTATDPYQQIEAKAKLTLQCLEVLAEYDVPVSITTRSPLILRDLDLLRGMNITSVNVSLNTLDRDVWRQFEPSSPSPDKRLDTIRELTDAGIEAGIFMAPILPCITDSDEQLENVIAGAIQAGARFIHHSVLRLSTPEVKFWFFGALNRQYPQWAETYGEMYHGSGHAPEEYRRRLSRKVSDLLAKHGVRPSEPRQRPVRPTPPPPPKEEAEQLTLW